MAKRKKLLYTEILHKLPNSIQSIEIVDTRYGGKMIFDTYTHAIDVLRVLDKELVGNDIAHLMDTRTVLSMLMCNPKFNKAFKIRVFSNCYQNY